MKVIPSLLTLCALLAVGWSCKNSSVPKQSKQADTAQLQENYTLFSQPVTFSGTIGNYPIFMKFNYCGYAWLVGFNIAQTNKRNISGLYTKSHDTFYIKLKEPGSQENDGSFDLFMIEEDTLLQGKWTSADNKTELPVKMSIKNEITQINKAIQSKVGTWTLADTFRKWDSEIINNSKKLSLDLSEDCVCCLTYYNNFEDEMEQIKKQYGYWFFNNNKLKIIWLNNKYFKHKELTFIYKKPVSEEFSGTLKCEQEKIEFMGPI